MFLTHTVYCVVGDVKPYPINQSINLQVYPIDVHLLRARLRRESVLQAVNKLNSVKS